jgi:hypothetical protein
MQLNNRFKFSLVVLFAAGGIISACSIWGDQPGEDLPVNNPATAAAETLVVELTQAAPALWTPTPRSETPTPFPAEPYPTHTPTSIEPFPTHTHTPTLPATNTPLPTETPLPPSPTPTEVSRPDTQTAPTPNSPAPTLILPTPVEVSPTPFQSAPVLSPQISTPQSTPTQAQITPISPTQSTPIFGSTPTQSTSPGQGEVLLLDDFSVQSWVETNHANYRFYYAENGYRIQNNYLNQFINSVRSFQIEDVYMEINVRLNSGSQAAYYGLVCRWQDTHNYYGLGISGAGAYSIFRVQNGQIFILAEGEDEKNIITPAFENDIVGASCSDNQLRLFVNGESLLTVQDTTFQDGQVGLTVLTREGPAEAHFESFSLARP